MGIAIAVRTVGKLIVRSPVIVHGTACKDRQNTDFAHRCLTPFGMNIIISQGIGAGNMEPLCFNSYADTTFIKVRQTSRPQGEVFGKYSIAANQGLDYGGVGMFNGLKSLEIFPVIAIQKGAVERDTPLKMFYGFRVGDAVSGDSEKFIEQMDRPLNIQMEINFGI